MRGWRFGVRSQFVALAVATYVGAAVLEAQTPLYNVQDMTPFAFAVVDTFHFGDADAVIVRRVIGESGRRDIVDAAKKRHISSDPNPPRRTNASLQKPRRSGTSE